MKILVTGAAGLIGSHSVKLLEAEGHRVIPLDRSECDILNIERLHKLFDLSRPEAVLHLAAQSSLPYSIDRWVEDAQTNIMGTINVVKVSQKYGVKRIVYASSGGCVYDPDNRLPFREDMPTRPVSPYGISKLAGEHYVSISGISYAILRYPNTFGVGPAPRNPGVIPIFIQNILDGKPSFVSIGASKDFVYIDDVAGANLKALMRDAEGVFNIGSGEETPIEKVLWLVQKALDMAAPFEYRVIPREEIPRICFDITKAREQLGWSPTISLPEGISLMVEAAKHREVCHAL